MRGKALFAAFVFCCATVGASHSASAASGNQDLLEQMRREGWTVAGPGVMQRDLGHGKVETLGFGADGLRFRIKQATELLSFLRQEYANHPTPNVRKAIRSFKAEIEHLTKALETAKSIDETEGLSALGEKTSGGIDCTIKYGGHVNAFPLSGSSPGVSANADAYFNSNCGQTGEVTAFSYSTATGADNVVRTATHHDPLSGYRSGGNVTANTSDNVIGVRDCFSTSRATMTSYDLGITYDQTVENRTCPVPTTPPSVTVSSNSGTPLYIYEYDCATVTWTASGSGGSAPYSYAWYNGATYLGSGASYTRSFCGTNVAKTQTYTITANLTDSAAQPASASQTTTLYYYRVTTTTGCSQASTSDGKIAQYPCN
jgi:hypothetical protein